MKTPHHELETIFELLAPGTGIHEWKTIPLTVMVARFMAILDVQGMVAGLKVNTFNPQDESTFLTMPNGHLRSDIFRTFLGSKGYVVYVKPADNYFAITQKDAVKFLRSCDRDNGILEKFERMMKIHSVFVEAVNATNLLKIEYNNNHGLVSYKGQRTAANGVMIMFEANSLSLFNAKDILYRLTNMAKVKEHCDRSNGCLTAVCEDGEVLLRTDAVNLGLQLFNGADISLISEGNIATRIRIGWNAFGLFSNTSFETLKVDIDQLVAVHQLKSQLAAKLTASIKRNKILYAHNECSVTLTLDDQDACLLSPLLIRMNQNKNSEARAGVYTYSPAQVTQLMQVDQHDVFIQIGARHEMIALYRALSAVLGAAFISRIKAALAVEGEIVFNDEFFNMGIEKLKAVRAEVEAQQRKVEVVVPPAPRQVSSEPLSPKIRRKVVEPVADYVGSVDLLPAIKVANSGVNKTGTKLKLKKFTKQSAPKSTSKSPPAKQAVVSAKIKSAISSKEKPTVRTPLPKPDDYVDVSHLPVNLDQLTISQAVPKKKKCGNIKKVNKAIREASTRLEDSLSFVSSAQQEEGQLAVHYSTLFTLLKLMDAIHTRHQASDLCVQLTANDADAGEIVEALTVYLPPFAGLLEFQRLLATEGRLQDVLTGVASANKKPISLKASFSFFAHLPEVDVVQSVHTTFRDMIKLGDYFNSRFKEFEAQADVKVATASSLFAYQQPLPAHEAQAIQGCINKLARLYPMAMKANLRDKFPAEVITFMETCVVEKTRGHTRWFTYACKAWSSCV
jgi:hypothetical protein